MGQVDRGRGAGGQGYSGRGDRVTGDRGQGVHPAAEPSVAQVRVDVDLLLDPGCEVGHITVDSRSQNLTEAHAAP